MFDKFVVKDSKKKIAQAKLAPTKDAAETLRLKRQKSVIKNIDEIISDYKPTGDYNKRGWVKPFSEDGMMLCAIRAGRYPMIVDKKVQDDTGSVLVPTDKVPEFYKSVKAELLSGKHDDLIMKTFDQKPSK